MHALALGLALLGFAVVTGTWVHYLSTIPDARVPETPVAHPVAMLAGMAASVVALALELSLLTLLPAAVSLGNGMGFLWLLSQRRLPDGELVVERGAPLPRFKAWDHRGEPFDSASLAGRRVLLKFFRGHW